MCSQVSLTAAWHCAAVTTSEPRLLLAVPTLIRHGGRPRRRTGCICTTGESHRHWCRCTPRQRLCWTLASTACQPSCQVGVLLAVGNGCSEVVAWDVAGEIEVNYPDEHLTSLGKRQNVHFTSQAASGTFDRPCCAIRKPSIACCSLLLFCNNVLTCQL